MNESECKPRVLVVEDQESMRQLIEDYLVDRGFEIFGCATANDAIHTLGIPHPDGNSLERSSTTTTKGSFDAVLTDITMPGISGIEFCRWLRKYRPDLPVIVMTAFGSLETSIESLRAGAYDFVTKPVEMELLSASLARAARQTSLKRQIRELKSRALDIHFPSLLGESDAMRNLKKQLERVVASNVTVLLIGESGTGKEVVARSIHANSARQDKPFVAINCAALPENLLESELFGHKKGAFTDANEDRIGLILQANGGTLFLDEIGEMPLEMQPKLLRVLEQKTVRQIGGAEETSFDVHLITATNRDLEAEVEKKRFREDLFYRINVLQISVPPLRTRGADVLLLSNYFLQEFSSAQQKSIPGLDDEVVKKLMGYDWPGNVRELKNVIERAVVLSGNEPVHLDNLPKKIAEHQPDRLVLMADDNQPLENLATIERRYIEFVLSKTGGNKTEAAKILGLDRKTLYRKLK